jgi:hypothetical protein
VGFQQESGDALWACGLLGLTAVPVALRFVRRTDFGVGAFSPEATPREDTAPPIPSARSAHARRADDFG